MLEFVREVEVETGRLRGVRGNDPFVTVFRGVPYAAPPVGQLRWRKPQPPIPWEGTLDCDAFKPASIQPCLTDSDNEAADFYHNEFHLWPAETSEDCLYLNIWMPARPHTEKLPVMMWIHGGGYYQGYSHEMEFDGEAICKRNVILVTINYRLGILGFMAHPELSVRSGDGVSGNYGFLDQVAALEWIKRNIASFGGDPENVTIFGQSAGGGAVCEHLASPKSKGLFHKAIIHSGVMRPGNKPMPLMQDNERVGQQICEALSMTMDELLQMDGAEMCDRLYKPKDQDGAKPLNLRLFSCEDGDTFVQDPERAFAKGEVHDVPVMIGSVAGDAGMLTMMMGDETKESITARSTACTRMVAEEWLANGKRPVYNFYFERNLPGGDDVGAYHSSELWYIFGTLGRCWRRMTGVDYEISSDMIDYWTNFARTGDPNGAGLPSWSPYTEEKKATMVFSDDGTQEICYNERAVNALRDEFLKRAYSLLEEK